jgi:hypothetical protein
MVVTVIIIISTLLVLADMNTGGVPLPIGEVPQWDWGFTPVAPLGCMGFTSNESALLQQKSLSSDGVLQPLPDVWFTYKDGSGQTQKGLQIPRVGTEGHYTWKKDPASPTGWTIDTLTSFEAGNSKDCCRYLIDSGGRKSAIYDSKDSSCYVFDYMSLLPKDAHDSDEHYKSADFANVFPLHQKKSELMQVDDINPSQRFVFMTACGGEGQLPCDYIKYQAPAGPLSADKWPPETRGCSQEGGAVPSRGIQPTVKLFRTPVTSPLPYSDDTPWEICQTQPYVRNFGYQPLDPEGCLKDQTCIGKPNLWHWPTELPVFDPTSKEKYDPNESNARYMMFS